MAEQLAELSYKGDLDSLLLGVQYAVRGPCSGSMAAFARRSGVWDRFNRLRCGPGPCRFLICSPRLRLRPLSRPCLRDCEL